MMLMMLLPMIIAMLVAVEEYRQRQTLSRERRSA